MGVSSDVMQLVFMPAIPFILISIFYFFFSFLCEYHGVSVDSEKGEYTENKHIPKS